MRFLVPLRVAFFSRTAHLFFVAALFMFVFQMEARLISYAYLFHEGILLVESILLGGGLFLLAHQLPFWRRCGEQLSDFLPVALFSTLALQLFVFFAFNHFYLDVLALALLFGLFFVAIARFIDLPAGRFYGTELLGSAAGVALYTLAVSHLLEEIILILLACVLLGYVAVSVRTMRAHITFAPVLVFSAAALLTIGMYAVFTSAPLSALIQCNERGTSYTYKAACLDDSTGLKPVASFSHLVGRTDVYEREGAYGNLFLEAKNAGYRVSSAHREDERGEEWFDLLEHRIPPVDYKPESRVLSVGAGAGSYVQAFEAYVENPHITAIEIDRTVEDMYESGQFAAYLPERGSYELRYDEGRRYITLGDRKYDVITVAIEGINSTRPEYVDERSSLLYTKEALAGYVAHLADDGYLVLENYYPDGPYGDAMAVKFLNTFAEAVGDREVLQDHLMLYTWRFHPSPSAQRFIAGVYSKDGFTDADYAVFGNWLTRLQEFEGQNGVVNPHVITPLHIPDNPVIPAVTYTSFFSDIERAAISAAYDTTPVTDERPFRHKVTTLPFPPSSYAFFGLFTALFLVVLGRVTEAQTVPARPLALAALFGIATFGLQYLLFYKTAAFLHTSLIFFSVFLIIPLFFSGLGGFLSTRLSTRQLTLATVLAALAAVLISALNVFAQPLLLVFTLIAILFVYAGFLFPLLIHPYTDPRTRSILYAVNLFAGGLAFLLLTTLHATLGWTPTFVLAVVAVGGGVVIAYRYAQRT